MLRKECLATRESERENLQSYFNLVFVIFSYTRPGRLTDGPYTSYDLNTLLKATAGQRRAVLIGQGMA